MLSQSDKQLLDAIHSSDYKAFEMLFGKYYSDLCKFANSIVHSSEMAEDIVSDLFVKIWEQPLALSVSLSLKGYLYRSVHNNCINYLARSRKQFQELNAETIDKLYELLPSLSGDDASTALMAADLDERIENAIEKLPTECGKIFIMSRKDELSIHEIAQQLKISENTVKVQIGRALSKLREALKEYL